MTEPEALQKMKDFWVKTKGTDYLNALYGLRTDVPVDHKSSKSLDAEIRICSKIYSKFVLWTKTKTARALLNKDTSNA